MKVRIPADVDMADRIFAGLTARQLAIIGGHLLVLWALWAAVGGSVPPYAFGALAVPVAAVGFTWATAKVEGTTLERLVAAAVRFLRAPRKRVLAPEGVPEAPRWARASVSPVAPLELPVSGAGSDGAIDLADDGTAAICRASSINFALRSEAEQRALVEAFGRLLNALDAPIQFVVRSDRADLRTVVDDLERSAGALPHPALERAALEHAGFLRALSARRDVLARQVVVCFRDPRPPEEATPHLTRRVEEAGGLLRGMGIRLARLEEDAERLIASACDPEAPARPPTTAANGIVWGRA